MTESLETHNYTNKMAILVGVQIDLICVEKTEIEKSVFILEDITRAS